MPARIDHLILKVNDARTSVDFYTRILGFTEEGMDGPFSVVRVDPNFTLQLAPWGTKGGEHLAFAMTKVEFEETFTRLKANGVEYGASFDSVGKQDGPGEETGARGLGRTIYFFDPSKHLIEIRHYERA